ncbi:MBL fold metallo-hydrolase [Paenibacillus selenitireducens]|uniref:MBL fold metallo-hydrolase n=1 Tax=Paenibacillus selenitireducens TaxID=1324314 RepID=A0A1T2X0Z4_9BACL|nr:MBL fold metallo-hydrolase [Paenibacillus selenitireducens]OPA73386.1 MBL fold metallo-hydrolase [Paenibacillus selenitireducens]
MKIKWFGQSCFLLTSSSGTRLLIDPYNRLLGYRMPLIETDILAITHDHRDHNQIQAATGYDLLVNKPYVYTHNQVTIRGIPTYHDKVNGAKRGNNTVYVIQMDDLTICHCGDLGHLLSSDQVREIGHVDILMVPVGGTRTLDGREAAETIHQLQPAITIPMHYRTKALGLAGCFLFDKVDTFLQASGMNVSEVHELHVTKEQLPTTAHVVVLHYESIR